MNGGARSIKVFGNSVNDGARSIKHLGNFVKGGANFIKLLVKSINTIAIITNGGARK